MIGKPPDPSAWFGANLRPAQRARLDALGRSARFAAGHEIVHEGAPVTELGVLTSGRLALRLYVPGRGHLTILTVEPGDVFDWSAVVPPYRASSTIAVIEQADAIVYEAAALQAALAEDAELAAIVYQRLLTAVARRLQATRLQLLDLFGREGASPWM